MRTTLGILALTFTLVAPAFADDDAKTIAQRLNDQWVAAYNKRDADALMNCYTNDAIVLPQGSAQPIKSANNIRKFVNDMLKARLAHIALPVGEANMLDPDSLYQTGTWEADTGTQHMTGLYVSVVVRDGTSWKYRVDTWNMMPVEPATNGSASPTPDK